MTIMKRLILFVSLVTVWCTAVADSDITDNVSSSRDSVFAGKFIWVPDSMVGDVENYIRESKFRRNGYPDLEEKVLYRGDTLNMVLKTRNLGRYDRGLFNYLFIPKGQWHLGLTASYGEFSTEDLEILDLVKDVDLSAHSFAIRPYLSYFIRNNLSVGFRLSYSASKAKVNQFNVDIDEDMSFNLHDIMYRNESYTAALILQQYIGMSRGGRFGVFNEVELAFASGNGDFRRPYNGIPKNTHTTYMDARLNFSPGVCVLIMKNVSFNISFGVFGFYLRNEKQNVDGVNEGTRLTSGANFRFNIFNINFGLGIHI